MLLSNNTFLLVKACFTKPAVTLQSSIKAGTVDRFGKNMKKIFVLQKKCMRLLTFSDYRERTSPIFKSLKALKLRDIIKFSILKLIYFYFNDQLPLQVKNIFIKNESVNPYKTRGGKLLFIPHINATHFGTKLLRYNGPLTWNNFSQSMNNNNFVNLGISKFKKFLKDLILENY